MGYWENSGVVVRLCLGEDCSPGLERAIPFWFIFSFIYFSS